MPTPLRAAAAPRAAPPPPAWLQRALNAAPSARNLLNAASDATNLPGQLRSTRDAWVNRPRSMADVRTQTRANWSAAARDARHGPTDVFDRRALAGRTVRTARQVTSAYNLPQTAGTAWRDLRQALRTGSGRDIATAAGSLGSLVNDTVQVGTHALELARDANRFGQSYRAARTAFTARAPGAPQAARRAATRVAADSMRLRVNDGRVTGGPTRSAMQQRATTAARSAATQAGERAIEQAATRAARAGRAAAVRVTTGTLARTAGRFVPLANAAIAVADTATAYNALRDPNASTGRRVTSVITAIGSIAAATNIPIVSQVGAVVSTISSIIGSWFS